MNNANHFRQIRYQYQHLTQFIYWKCSPRQTPHCSRCLSTLPNKPSPRIVFSGIQPTGIPHLGNYLGALRQWVRLQRQSLPATKLFFSIVDLHAITIPQDSRNLRSWKRETLASLLAIGLDPQRCVIFYQSDVSLLSFPTRQVSLLRLAYIVKLTGIERYHSMPN